MSRFFSKNSIPPMICGTFSKQLHFFPQQNAGFLDAMFSFTSFNRHSLQCLQLDSSSRHATNSGNSPFQNALLHPEHFPERHSMSQAS